MGYFFSAADCDFNPEKNRLLCYRRERSKKGALLNGRHFTAEKGGNECREKRG